MKNIFYRYSWVALIILSALIFWRWFFTLGTLTFGDWGFLFNEQMGQFVSFPQGWATTGFGQQFLTVSQYPLRLLWGIFSLISPSYSFELGERIIYLVPAAVLSFLSVYLFIRHSFKKQETFTAIVGAIVYALSTYILITKANSIQIGLAISFAPLFFLWLLKLVNSESTQDIKKYSFLTTFSALILCIIEFRIFYICVLASSAYLIYFIFNYKVSREKTFFIFVSGLILLLLNSFWLLGSMAGSSISSNLLFERPLFGAQYITLSNALTLFHSFWSGGYLKWFVIHPVPFYFWFVPIIATMGFLLNRKKPLATVAATISLIGITLVKSTNLPLPELYIWLFGFFPGFNAFRDSSKFFFLVAFGYAILIAFFTDWFLKNSSSLRIKALFLIFVCSLFFLNAIPIITGSAGTLFVSRYIPTDYVAFKNLVEEENTYFRTLWIPTDSRWTFYTNLNPVLSGADLSQETWSELYQSLSPNATTQTQIVNLFKQPFSQELLNVSAVKYVFIPVADKANDDDFFVSYGGTKDPNIRQWYINQLDQVPFLKKIDIGTKDLVVYENTDYKEPISTFTTLYSLDSTDNLDTKYDFINNQLKEQFYFTIPTTKSDVNSTTRIFVPFKDLGHSIKSGSNVLVSTASIDAQKDTTLYRMGSVDGNVRINGSVVPYGSKIPLSLPTGENDITYQDAAYSFTNLISNGSFESGAWQQKVGDCHNYDKNPLIAMSLNTQDKSDGAQSLQLEATRHNACNSTKIPVKAGASYLFSFDYQSPDVSTGSYYLGFNDKLKTVVSAKLPITDKNWHTLSRTIVAPDGATVVSLYVYALQSDGKTNNINRYDNFKLIEIPDISNSYYLVSQPKEQLQQPASTTFELINPTKKLVHIEGATTPFFLAMSESYHDKWQLQMNNARVQGFLNSWWPLAKPDAVPSEYHYQLDGFLNAWYVDTPALCAISGASCVKNADGSYDIEMVIEFWPQRWFYLGLLISGATLAGCLGYLGYDFYKRRKLRVKSIKIEN